MIIDNLREQLKNVDPDIATIKNYWAQSNIDARFTELEAQSQEPLFWQQAQLGKELQRIRLQKEQYSHIINSIKEFHELLSIFENDEQELASLQKDIGSLCQAIKKFKIDLLLNKPEDDSSCFLAINAGAGGTESQDWANMLLRMITRFCEQEKLPAEIIDYQAGNEAGIKSATLFIRGKNAYGLLKSEHGVHRLVRISPFDTNKRRHTSFASLLVTPETPDLEITIDPSDLRIDTYRSSGAGGQHVNTTDSAVRITHIPTNTVAQCQNERSQTKNKETAMKMLKARVAQKLKEEQEAKQNASIEKKSIEWGSQIRSYVLHPYKLVKDHRTDYESSQPDLVLDGQLMPFIEAYLVQQA